MSERIGPKRVRSLNIEDFSMADRRLLLQAFHSFIPMALIGGQETERPHVISLGHPDGLADTQTIPEGSRYYSLTRIQGVGATEAPAPELANPGPNLYTGGDFYTCTSLICSPFSYIDTEFRTFIHPVQRSSGRGLRPYVAGMGGPVIRPSLFRTANLAVASLKCSAQSGLWWAAPLREACVTLFTFSNLPRN